MRPNQASTPSLSLALTSFKPHSEENTKNQNASDNEYYSPTSPSSPTSLLSSSTTVTSTSYTFSAPNSPSLSAVQPQHIRSPRLISEKLKIGHSQSTESKANRATATVLRRRPSNIDILLQQEHARASVDAVERKGLDLLEPRPVDLEPIDPVGINVRGVQLQPGITRYRLPAQSPINNHGIDNDGHGDVKNERSPNQLGGAAQAEGMNPHSQPRFVMGGIFEVMEGRG